MCSAGKYWLAGVVFCLGAVTAGAQGDPPCTGGVVKDDGSTEIGWGWVPSVVEGQYVQEFHSGEFPTRSLETVCVCWLRTRADSDLDFEVVFYADAGGGPADAGGGPASVPFAAIPATATDVGIGAAEGRFFTVDVAGVPIPLGTFYIGVRWDPSRDEFFFICADTSPETEPVNVFFIDDRADAWTNVFDSADSIFDVHRAILVRAVASTTAAVDIPALGPGGLWILGGLLSVAGLGRLAGCGACKRRSPTRRSCHLRPMSESENGLR